MKKKVISALLASTMIVSLVACGSTGGDSSDTNSKSSGTTASRQAAMKQRIPHRTAAPAMQQVLVTGLQQLMKQMMQYRVKMTIVRLQNLIMS